MPKTPDTSPANVAKVLRDYATALTALERPIHGHEPLAVEYADVRALADALERQAGVTWEERVERAAEHTANEANGGDIWHSSPKRYQRKMREQADAILRHAFPEYAPQHAPTESESDD